MPAALAGRLDRVHAEWDSRAALGVVLAAAGYPETVRKGDVIPGSMPRPAAGQGISRGDRGRDGDNVTTNGGRVLCAVGLGESVACRAAQAYDLAQVISWPGMQYRRDIGSGP